MVSAAGSEWHKQNMCEDHGTTDPCNFSPCIHHST